MVQQQWLQRRPPRLLAIEPAAAGSGLAAVELRFSRPMDGASLQANLQLPADQPHELLRRQPLALAAQWHHAHQPAAHAADRWSRSTRQCAGAEPMAVGTPAGRS